MKKALITGVTGQDGSYLSEFLLGKGYEVHGIRRSASVFNTQRIDHLLSGDYGQFNLHYGDITDASNLNRLIEKIEPDEVYNLAAQSHVHLSFQIPEYTAQVDGLGTLRILDAIKETESPARFYQASTSELFGKASQVPQNEKTPFYPRSPYAAAKIFAYWTVINYREAYGLFACNGILFNHESPRRGETFVTRKISRGVAQIVSGMLDKIKLGNLDAKRDWGYAKDYVAAMWMMLQFKEPLDLVIATGESHTVRDFCQAAFQYVDIDLQWEGVGVDEKGVDSKTGKVLVEIDSKYFRPTEVDYLLGDSSKASHVLGWNPSIKFRELVSLMVAADLKTMRK